MSQSIDERVAGVPGHVVVQKLHVLCVEDPDVFLDGLPAEEVLATPPAQVGPGTGVFPIHTPVKPGIVYEIRSPIKKI